MRLYSTTEMTTTMRYMEFSEIIGFVFTDIAYINDEETLVFTRDTGQRYKMCHEQDCCEHVYLAEVIGDLSDLLNSPILMAEESTAEDPNVESGTWTFYKIATLKGFVDLRWIGESNGYYSESVFFGEIETLN